MLERKNLDMSILEGKAKAVQFDVSLDINKKGLTAKQRKLVDAVTNEIVNYTITKAKQVTAQEWLDLIKIVALAVIAAIKKDQTALILYLQQMGSFFIKHFLPDFVYESKLIVLTKEGENVKFKIK